MINTLWQGFSLRCTITDYSYYHERKEFESMYQFSSDQSFNHVWFFVTPRITACQAFLSITNSWSLLKPMSIESAMPSNHLILCHPLLLLSSIFLRIKVFSSESYCLWIDIHSKCHDIDATRMIKKLTYFAMQKKKKLFVGNSRSWIKRVHRHFTL